MTKKNFDLSSDLSAVALAKADIITIGGATRDIMFYTDKGKIIDNSKDPICQKLLGFEIAAKINIKEPYYSFGGGACNSAVNFSKLGFKTAAIIKVGNDKEGDEIIKDLKKYKVNTSLIQVDKKLATGFSFLVIGGKEKEYVAFLYRGANDNLQPITYNPQQFKKKWIYLSSLSGEKWKDVLAKIKKASSFAKATEDKRNFNPEIQLAWNPGNLQLKAGYASLRSFLAITDVLILNKDEAIELVYSSGRKIESIDQLLKKIKAWGPKIIAITEGSRGAWLYDGRKIYHQAAYSVKIVDTTGAGDAFGSTLVAGLILYNDLEKALKLAIINSASVLTEIGAHNGLLNLKELNKKLSKI